MNLNLLKCTSISEIRTALREYAKKESKELAGTIFGFGWDDEKYKDRRLPTRDDLDDICLDRPVILFRVCGHIAVVNSKALEICQIPNVWLFFLIFQLIFSL